MSKYIDADHLIHDLEERIYAYSEGYADGDDCRKDAIETLLKDVRYQYSLQQEQPELDLEKLGEIARHIIAVKQNVEDMRLNEDEWSLLERIGYPHKLKARKEDK